MDQFSTLYDRLDRTTSINAKVSAIAEYLRAVPPGDAAWGLFLLTGGRLKRLLPARLLSEWTRELTGYPGWLLHECYGAVGDGAETIALLLDRQLQPIEPAALRAPAPGGQRGLFDEPPDPIDTRVEGVGLQEWMERRILPLRDLDDGERRARVMAWWSRLGRRELLTLNKLMTGELRVGVSRTLVVRAVAIVAGLPSAVIEGRLLGGWEPSAEAFLALLAPEGARDEPARPYPFCLASPLPDLPATLGARDDWLAEWKWDGIRAQVIRRGGRVFVWSRGDELITTRFPEVAADATALPEGTVLDGELVAYEAGRPRPFADLQRRIGRDRDVRQVAGDVPVVFLAFDLLEDEGTDIRDHSLEVRRRRLVRLVEGREAIRLSEGLTPSTWSGLGELRAGSRAYGVEGIMLKRWSSPYRTGRRRGDWWKWKIEPYTIDAVLIYAQPGSGRRATLFTDYTFGVWDAGELVPVAKAYSGLTDAEIDELDRWIRRHTIERFGPVSAVEQVHVFELGFERIARSPRHRSGVALRFPRMLRWRRDKRPQEADTLDTLIRLIDTDHEGGR